MFIAAVRQGIPTAVFEDPAPMSMNVTATSQPKRPQGQMAMFGGGAPQPKGDIGRLWSYLGIDLIADRVVSQDYNPHKRLQFLPPEVVFIDEASSDQRSVFNERDPITSGLQELVFIFPGMLSAQKTGPLKYDQLVMTGDRTGYVGYNDLIQMSPFGGGGLNPRPRRRPTPGTYYCLALHVTGTPLAEPARQVEPGKSAPEPEKPAPLNVVVVADVDLFNSDIFGLRAMANNQSRSEIDFQFDNVPFVLNIIDVLAGDESLVEIRKRRPQHRPLERVEQVTKSVRDQTQRDVEHFLEEREKATNEAQRKMQEAVDKLNQRLKDADPSKITEELQKTQMATEKFKRETDATVAKLASDFEKKKAEADRRLDHEVRAVQKYYKVMALILPPLFPLLAGLAVFINRRAREREGVSRRRLR
jgi:ABC-2 type transport system permease protein